MTRAYDCSVQEGLKSKSKYRLDLMYCCDVTCTRIYQNLIKDKLKFTI
jgi:hypothetical protein